MFDFVGIDLAGNAKNPTGFARLSLGEKKKSPVFEETCLLYSDREILQRVSKSKPTLVAIDAPLTTSKGLAGTYSYRKVEQILWRLGLKLLPTALLRGLQARGVHLKNKWEQEDLQVIEIHPKTSRYFLSIEPKSSPDKDKKSSKISKIQISLRELIKNVPLPSESQLSSHEVDALTAAYTGYLKHQGRTKTVGDSQEGQLEVPLPHRLRLAVFDLDGTLTKPVSVWEHIHRRLGTWDSRGRENLRRFLKGEISYEEFAHLDAADWKGISLKYLQEIVDQIEYLEGVEETISCIKGEGITVAIISGGLSCLAEKVASELQADYVFANELLHNGTHLNGTVKVNVPYNGKFAIFKKLVKKANVKPVEVLSVGDSPGDIELFEASGLSIAVNPLSKEVSQAADFTISSFQEITTLINVSPTTVGVRPSTRR